MTALVFAVLTLLAAAPNAAAPTAAAASAATKRPAPAQPSTTTDAGGDSSAKTKSPSPAAEANTPASKPAAATASGPSTPAAKAATSPAVLPDTGRCLNAARAASSGGKTTNIEKGREAYTSLRRCLLAQIGAGYQDEALAIAKGADAMFPDEPLSGFDYGALLMRSGGDPAVAAAKLQGALKRTGKYLPPPTGAERAAALENLGVLALERGDVGAAREALMESRKLDPTVTEVLYRLAAVEKKAGNASACIQWSDEAFKASPAAATRDDYMIAAWAYNRTGKPLDAAALLRRGIAAMPNASGLHLSLGYSLASATQPMEALLEYWYEFENDAASDPYSKEARIQFKDALGRAQAVPKDTQSILLLRSAVIDQASDAAAVLADIAKLEAAGYKSPPIELLRAETLYTTGEIAQAESAFRALLVQDPAFIPTYLDLALILRSQDKNDEARRLVAEAVRRNPSHWQLIGEPAPLSTAD